jgi:hypothetical protein
LGAVEIVKAVADYHLKPSGIMIEVPFLSLQSHIEGRARTLGFPGQPFAFLTSFWIGAENGFNALGFKTTGTQGKSIALCLCNMEKKMNWSCNIRQMRSSMPLPPLTKNW